MIVVSGVSRSGTSLMMECLRKTFGDDRIFGEKFPREKSLKYMDKPFPGESPERFACRNYMRDEEREKRFLKDFKKSKDMNPNGFWESLYAVKGVYHRFGDRKNLDKWLTEKDKTICKIVCRGLIHSDPRFIDKIIYMVRHPRDVAKSQERLKRDLPVVVGDDGRTYDMADEITIHTPKMYIDVTRAAAMWLREYPTDVLNVAYDDLIENPSRVFADIRDFLGEGDFSEAVDSINPKLRRSADSNVDHVLWEVAEKVHEMITVKDYKGIVEYLKDKDLNAMDGSARFFCPRAGRAVCYNECELCQSSPEVRKNYKKFSEESGVDWLNEPCLYECGNGEGPFISIEDSVAVNFWRE